LAVKHLRHYLEGHHILAYATQEKSLISAKLSNSPRSSATLMAQTMRWLTCFSDLPSRRFISHTRLNLTQWWLSNDVSLTIGTGTNLCDLWLLLIAHSGPPRCVELLSKVFMGTLTLGFKPRKSSSRKGSLARPEVGC
uniref:Reverse transcriptase domain-containing protein n=1 Tax=Schistocephalus solidus TaxID=70667 RepID=A0A183TPP5_SCHSO